jgi:glycosyltransferase involved in cell wall biosynthesis
MLHNLDWLHHLDIQYDASTFDTDPFEPQPEGRGTIFPFWVPRPEIRGQRSEVRDQEAGRGRQKSEIGSQRSELTSPSGPLTSDPRPLTSPATPQTSDLRPLTSGYIELPYTLPQDSTLFLLLRETTPDIWLRKLDWIAAHGGMALVNVHPDYLQFDDGAPSGRTVPVTHYRRLLEHVRRQHTDAFWQVTPGEVATYVTGFSSYPVRRQPLRVCMLAYSFYESDNRVTRYAEALAERGDHVDVLALRSGPAVSRLESMNGVRVHRIQSRFGKTERSRFGYLAPLVRFLLRSALWITRAHLRQRYDLFHIHNVPDFLVFAAWYPKLTGARVILDIHDIVPEFYASKFFGKDAKPLNPALLAVERWAARFADHVILANHLWHEKYTARTGTAAKCTVFINNVDTRTFPPTPRTRRDGKRIMLFPGGLQWHQGLDIAIRAMQRLRTRLPDLEFHIYGDGNMKPALQALAQELGLNGQVRFFQPTSIHQIAKIMANADLGVVPKRADSFGNEAYSTKIMEFMALGVPVVVSSTRIDRHYFDDSVVRFFESGNSDALAEAIQDVLSDESRREVQVAQASAYVARNSWETRKADYLELVDSLCPTPGGRKAEDRGRRTEKGLSNGKAN